MAIHKGKMFPEDGNGYSQFFKYGVGAMCWAKDEAGRRVLYFIAPNPSCPDPDNPLSKDLARIYPYSNGEDWCVPGDVCGWDGNVEKPTFHPSIWLRSTNGWHGFIENGDLRDA